MLIDHCEVKMKQFCLIINETSQRLKSQLILRVESLVRFTHFFLFRGFKSRL